MDPSDFDELLNRARDARHLLETLYKDVTGEDLDIEGAVRHYPLLAVGLAAGAGVLGGWWLGRKQQPQLPPPPPERAPSRFEGLGNPFEMLEGFIPGAAEKVRERMPEVVVSEEVKTIARTWISGVLEPKLKGTGNDATLGGILRHVVQRMDTSEDIELEDAPPGSETT